MDDPLAEINRITANRLEEKGALNEALAEAVKAGHNAAEIAKAFSPAISRQAAHKRIQLMREREGKEE